MRVDPALWRELERWAADDLRSINGQVEFILREALRRRGVRGGARTEEHDAASTDEVAAPQDTVTPQEPR